MAKRKSTFIRSDKPTGYEKTPDALMGVRDPSRGRGAAQPYHEGSGRSHRVQVTTPSGETFKDEVRGRSAEHALERAKRNWPGSSVRLTKLVRSAAGAVLSPAGLAEEVAGRVARDVKAKRESARPATEAGRKSEARRSRRERT